MSHCCFEPRRRYFTLSPLGGLIFVLQFDTTDRDRHYVMVVPQRAVYNHLLMYAICTAAARYLTQLWTKRGPNQVIEFHGIPLPELNKESAIHYHNKCISYLMDTSTDPANPCNDDALTAITILRYHEQVDSKISPQRLPFISRLH